MRISTQAFVRVNGERRVMEHTDTSGVTRAIEVEIDLEQCDICGSLLALIGLNATHKAWHKRMGQ